MRFRVLHFFCGLGGKALGFQASSATHAGVTATFETIGGIDFNELACRDFTRLTGAPALCANVHTMEPADLLAFAGPDAPDVVAMSPPCKGLSGLLSEKKAAEPKYQEMNTLMLRALMLIASTWDRPPPIIFVENVPRMSSRGAEVVRKSSAILEHAGYAINIGTHDCGEIGGLAQHRVRWFLAARHRAQVPQVVYQPRKQRVRACGEVLGRLPMPGDIAAAGPMHAVPDLHWCNWLRLAEIPAGGDWRDIPGGSSSTFGHVDRVTPIGTVTRSPAPSSGGGAVADPRTAFGDNANRHRHKYAVRAWEQSSFTITSTSTVGGGAPSVADPRIALPFKAGRHWNKYAVAAWDHPAPVIIGALQVGSGAPSVADPRVPRNDDLGVIGWSEPSGAITGDARPRKGRFAVADPRFSEGKKKNWQRVAGVIAWDKPIDTVTSGAGIHAGAFQVADPRIVSQPRYVIMTLEQARAADFDPKKPVPFIPVIIAADGTWHRPLTTLELGVLQALPWIVNGEPLVLAVREGARSGHTRWREAIGNAVPPDAAQSVGDQLLEALVIAALGSFALSNNDIWVAPSAEAVM
jgi:site-specific DNA-cytosine methylase